MAVNIQQFQKDLKNGMSLAECCKEHSVELKDIIGYLVSHNKKQTSAKNKKSKKPNRNIHFKGNRYYIERRKSGEKQKVIATFKELEDAQTVRDELEKCNWDISQLKKILLKTGIKSLPKHCVIQNENAYIQPTGYGTYHIRKGVKTAEGVWRWVFYGTYSSLEDAKKIRDGLIEYHWQKNQLWRIKKKYGIKDSKGR